MGRGVGTVKELKFSEGVLEGAQEDFSVLWTEGMAFEQMSYRH
jgi:hypothetical protein